MANNFIPIDQSKRKGIRLLRYVELTREALQLANEIRDNMAEMTDGADYATIEAQYGLPTGKGDETQALVIAARNAIQNSGTTQLIDRLG